MTFVQVNKGRKKFKWWHLMTSSTKDLETVPNSKVEQALDILKGLCHTNSIWIP